MATTTNREDWLKRVDAQIAKINPKHTDLLDAIEVWRQEIAESHALLRRARIVMLDAKKAITPPVNEPSMTQKNLIARLTKVIKEIPANL